MPSKKNRRKPWHTSENITHVRDFQLNDLELTTEELNDLQLNFSVYEIKQYLQRNSVVERPIHIQTYLTRKDTSSGSVSSPRMPVYSKKQFAKFVGDYAPCEWNYEHANAIYRFLNVSSYIVQPNQFLSISLQGGNSPNLMIDSVLSELERKKYSFGRYPPWSHVRHDVNQILHVFHGLEQFSDQLLDTKVAEKYAIRFYEKLKSHYKAGEQRYFLPLMKFAEKLIKNCGNPDEKLFESFVTTLIQIFDTIGQVFVNVQSEEVKLVVPHKDGFEEKIILHPDIVVTQKVIILVGEVKNLPDHRLLASKENAAIRPLMEGEKKKGQKRKFEEAFPEPFKNFRTLTKSEVYKMRGVLPELLGQMLAAMQNNGRPLPLGAAGEGVQLGFAVEGFKLRFVKLVLQGQSLSQSSDSVYPNPFEVFDGNRNRSWNVFITQEFNLFNKRHLEMFFRMILAICYLCDGDDSV